MMLCVWCYASLPAGAAPGSGLAEGSGGDWTLSLPENGVEIVLRGAAAREARPLEWSITGGAGKVTGTIRCGERPILCRVTPGDRRDVIQAQLGDSARNLRANALFNRDSDCAVVVNGLELSPDSGGTFRVGGKVAVEAAVIELIPHYFRDRRNVKYHEPLDKTVHRRAPSGWCSWYYYYQDVNENDVIENAQWMARELKPFGAEYIQLDDGWQGTGTGDGSNRDFFVTAGTFPHGMRWLADQIHALGLKAGIWTAPFGQSSDLLFKQSPELFLKRADGSSVGKNADGGDHWVGRYIIDTSGEPGQNYMRKLFSMMARDWGYDYFKIDGQPDIPMFYTQYHDQLAKPQHGPAEAEILALNTIRSNGNHLYKHQEDCDGEAYRAGLAAMREAIGEHRFLLGCGGMPLIHGLGFMDGSRTGTDVIAKWSGVRTTVEAMLRGYYQHNILWYADPDVLCVRDPLTFDEAQMWATLLGLSGQLLLVSDKMTDLPEDRVELLRRVFPAADVTPVDLYPGDEYPAVWDTKISASAGEWDVVGLFNYSETVETVACSLEDIGLDPDREYVAYDFWNRQYSGAVLNHSLKMDLAPHSCRVLAVREARPHPQIVSTSRHILQGAEDLHHVSWNEEKGLLSGVADVVGGDPYEIRIALPEDGASYQVGKAGVKEAKVRVKTEGSLVTVTLETDANRSVRWNIGFTKN